MEKSFKYHCYGCHHVESATANTLFDKVKFGLQKAFCVVFEMTTSSKSLSSTQLAERYGISQSSMWFFMQKVRKAMESSKQYPLSHEPLKATYDITQIESNSGKNFKKLHIIIHQVKSWLRTIPRHVSKAHIQKYFDEFAYRINRSQSKSTIWHNSIIRMTQNKPITWNQIKQNLN